MKNSDITLEILKLAAKELEPLNDQLVYVGGSTISLYITETDIITVRETNDVDCVVEVSHRNEYEALAKQLRKIGFHEDPEEKVLCRFRKGSLILDVMPTDTRILGFTNQWYADGYKNSKELMAGKTKIRVFDLPYLIATKIEAFNGRGKNQLETSHDIEDIVTLFDGRPTIADDLKVANSNLKAYLKQHLDLMLKNPRFEAALDGHISDRQNIEVRKQIVLDRIQEFLKIT